MAKQSNIVSQNSPESLGLLQDPYDFSLVLGGPLYQLLRRAYLSGEALELLGRRILVISLLAWLPLLVLSVWAGQALGGGANSTVPVGRGGARPFSGGTAAADPRGAGGPHADASAGAAIPGAPSGSGERAGPVRGRGGVSAPVAQLGCGRGASHRAGVRGRRPDHLASLCGAGHGHLVCGASGGAVAALAGRVMVRLCQPADVPVHAAALVFPVVHLGAVALAGVAPRTEPRAHAPGRRRRFGVPVPDRPCLHAAVAGTGDPICGDDRQPHFVPRGQAAGVHQRSRARGGGVRCSRCSVRSWSSSRSWCG